jgi:transcriptional regulator
MKEFIKIIILNTLTFGIYGAHKNIKEIEKKAHKNIEEIENSIKISPPTKEYL